MPRVFLTAALALAATAAAAQPVVADVTDAGRGLRFARPVGVETAPGEFGRLFVVEQGGGAAPSRIVTFVPGDGVASTFLDLSDRTAAGGEAGLLGLAFHPDYAENGRLFVHYTAPVEAPVPDVRVLVSRVSEFARSATDPLRADPASERVLLEADQPATNHNGGTVDFGDDGLLYVSLGDGGGGGDPYGNGQDPTTLLGAVLRIDVDDVPEGEPYGIPDGNPFALTDGPERDEIFAYGFRNPYKLDAGPAGVWVADVGQAAWEEVDLVEAGGNYGWNEVEGPDCFQPGCDLGAFEAPVAAYAHPPGGASITGGPALLIADYSLGFHYYFGDFIGGQLWALPLDDVFTAGTAEPVLLFERFPDFEGGDRRINISSIDDEFGDLLVSDYTTGTIYRLTGQGTDAEAGPRAGAGGLSLAGPNPFRERTAVRVEAPGATRVALLDALGRRVAVLHEGGPRGPVEVEGAGLAPGVYTVVATGGGRVRTLRVVRAR